MERLQASNDGDDEMKTTIDMAREAGFETMLRKGKILGFDRDNDYTEELKAFEALVRADEREACVKVCEELDAEYEAVCQMTSVMCGQAIRNRGNT
jgi:hypothetical protein